MDFKCKNNCNGEVFIKPKSNHLGLYCSNCGAWIKWLTQKEANDIYEYMQQNQRNEGRAFKKVKKVGKANMMRCSVCRCQLYNSACPAPVGQFNLVGAKFCPQCGREFI